MAYLADGTAGVPGMKTGNLLEPAGVLSKTLEALFLVLCAFELASGFGRRALITGVPAVLGAAGLASALILLGVAPAGHHGDEPSPSDHHHDEWPTRSLGNAPGAGIGAVLREQRRNAKR